MKRFLPKWKVFFIEDFQRKFDYWLVISTNEKEGAMPLLFSKSNFIHFTYTYISTLVIRIQIKYSSSSFTNEYIPYHSEQIHESHRWWSMIWSEEWILTWRWSNLNDFFVFFALKTEINELSFKENEITFFLMTKKLLSDWKKIFLYPFILFNQILPTISKKSPEEIFVDVVLTLTRKWLWSTLIDTSDQIQFHLTILTDQFKLKSVHLANYLFI